MANSTILGNLVKAAIDAFIITLSETKQRSFSDADRKILLERMFEPVDPCGSIVMYAGAVMPGGWLLCDGRTMGKTGSGATLQGEQYHALYDVIQNLYGGVANWDGLGVVKIPDFGGIFPRGAGVSNTLTKANGAPFAGSTGQYQNDMGQGHWHSFIIGAGGALGSSITASGIASSTTGTTVVTSPVRIAYNDGVNGVPRIGTETNPANLSVPFIIKY